MSVGTIRRLVDRKRERSGLLPGGATDDDAKLPIPWTAKADPPQQSDRPAAVNTTDLKFKDASSLIYRTPPGKFIVVGLNGEKTRSIISSIWNQVNRWASQPLF